MSNNGKLYRMDLDRYLANEAKIGKLPNQQKQILAALADWSMENEGGLHGSQIVDLAKKKFGLVTRQKSTVLYAWYARSNEAYGVDQVKEAEVPAETFPNDEDLIKQGVFAE